MLCKLLTGSYSPTRRLSIVTLEIFITRKEKYLQTGLHWNSTVKVIAVPFATTSPITVKFAILKLRIGNTHSFDRLIRQPLKSSEDTYVEE